ncbi:MAG: glycosyltransferase family A protein [Acidobacteriota bacterium]
MTGTPLFSVVIPTYRRPHTLFQVLEGLARQTSPPAFEVIVIDDGSRDDTWRRLRAYRPDYAFRALEKENGGPASARNRGVEEARGRFILFLGDDTVPEPRLLAVHGAAQAEERGYPVAVLGYTTWPRERRVSPFLHHINEYGLQFGYALIDDPESVPFNFFYTSNISLPRSLLFEEGLFDTTFPGAAWEDIEISYRLMGRGMKIIYRPEAVARHHHDITFTSFRRRQEKAGESAAIFYAKHPELGDFLAVPQALRFQDGHALSSRLRAWWAALGERWEIPGARRAIDRVLREDYLRGLRRRLPSAAETGEAPAVSFSGRRLT